MTENADLFAVDEDMLVLSAGDQTLTDLKVHVFPTIVAVSANGTIRNVTFGYNGSLREEALFDGI